MEFRRYTHIFLAVLFLGLLALSISGLVPEAKAVTVSAADIRNKAIHGYHLSDSLAAVLMFEASDSTAWYARYARGMVDGSLQWADFSQGLKDSLVGSAGIVLIHRADTAAFAEALAAGGLSDTNMFSSDVRNRIRGLIFNQPWIHLAANALHADDADDADHADHATFADSSGKAPSSSVADSAGVAAYAYLAGAVVVEDATVTWASLSSAVQDSIYLAPHYADSSGKVVVGGISAIGQFSSGMQASNIPTTGEKSGLKGTTVWGAAVSAGNRVVDSTSAAKHFVQAQQDTLRTVVDWGTRTTVGNTAYNIGIDSTPAVGKVKLVFSRGASGSEQGIFEDSIAIHAAINDTIADAVLKGNGLPGRIYVKTSPAPSAVRGDMYLDTLAGDTGRLYYANAAGSWKLVGIGGSGGGGNDSIVKTDWYGDVDADSLAIRSAEYNVFPHKVQVDSLYPQTVTAQVGKSGDPFAFGAITTLESDTIRGAGTSGSLIIGDTLLFLPTGLTHCIGEAFKTITTTHNPYIFSRFMYTQGSSATDGVGILAPNNPLGNAIIPLTSLGTGYGYVGNSVGAFRGFYFGHDGTIWDGDPAHSEFAFVSDAGAGLTVSNGYVTGSTGNFPTINSTNIENVGYVNSPAYKIGGVNHYLLTKHQNDAIDSACGADSSNPFITRDYLRRQSMASYPIPDGFFTNWQTAFSFVNLFFRDTMTCPSPNDTDANGFHQDTDPNAFFPVVIDTGWLPIDPTRFPTPGIHGMIHLDTTITGSTYGAPSVVDWNSPLESRMFIVSDGGNDSIGRYTGYFKTIQAALDNIPNVLCIAREQASASGDTGLQILTTAKSRILRYGKTGVDTVDVIPAAFHTPGVFFSYQLTTDDTDRVWLTVDHFKAASPTSDIDTFYVTDPTCFDNGVHGQALSVFALPWTVRVLPKASGAAWVVDSLRILDVAPVTIEGVGKQTIISNISNTGGLASSAHPTCLISFPTQDTTSSMQITIRDMTLVSAYNGTFRSPVMIFSGGEVTLENLDVKAHNLQSAVKFDQYGSLDNRQTPRGSLTITNCAMIADSDVSLIVIDSDCKFQSKNNEYGWGGSSGMFFSVTDTLRYQPQFIRDNIWTLPTSDTGFLTFSSTKPVVSDSVLAVQCWFSGKDITYDGAKFIRLHLNGNNTVQPFYTEAPVRIAQGRWLFKDNVISPK